MKALFTAAIFANAALIFWVELLFAKKLLPSLGGSPAVWNTCLMFFQVALLAGYGYALVLDRLRPERQVALHAGVVAAAILAVPASLFLWAAPPGSAPVPWLLALLVASVGPPFVVLAAGAPVLQRWFSLSGHPEAGDPYFLYAASNLGSFAALAAYPFLLEPTLTLGAQTLLWKISFAVVGLLVIGSGLLVLRSREGRGPRMGASPAGAGPAAGAGRVRMSGSASVLTGDGGPAVVLTMGRRLRWIGLAFVPSSLLLGVTTHITSEIAPVPLLWVVPLGIYLLTFVLAFGPGRVGTRPSARRRWGVATLGVGLAVGGWFLWGPVDVRWLLIAGDLGILLAAGLLCHVRVARDRPPASRLAEYYLFVALGGALGGVFNTLLAPILFTEPLEYPLVLALFAFLASSSERGAPGPVPDPKAAGPASPADPAPPSGGGAARGSSVRAVDLALGLLPATLAMGLPMFWSGLAPSFGIPGEPDPLLLLAVPGALCLALAGRPARFGMGVAGLVFVGFAFPATGYDVAYKERTFFGIHRVYFDGFRIWLAHGTTVHGGQDSRDPGVPLTYYHPDGPAGSLFRAFYSRGQDPGGARIAVVGLGTGSLIAYARPGQEWTFFELDPTVVRLAEDPRYFIFLRQAWVGYRTVLGDARISLEAEAAGAASLPPYDLLVVDAFSSDAIPVHLLTAEAIRLYRSRLAPGGWIAFHASNRYADFSGVLAGLAAEAGLVAQVGTDGVGEAEAGRYPSQWVVLTDGPVDLGDPRWRRIEGDGSRPWTDAYSSIFEVLRR